MCTTLLSTVAACSADSFGRQIRVTVMAESTQRAYRQAEHLYPGTRAMNARQQY